MWKQPRNYSFLMIYSMYSFNEVSIGIALDTEWISQKMKFSLNCFSLIYLRAASCCIAGWKHCNDILYKNSILIIQNGFPFGNWVINDIDPWNTVHNIFHTRRAYSYFVNPSQSGFINKKLIIPRNRALEIF